MNKPLNWTSKCIHFASVTIVFIFFISALIDKRLAIGDFAPFTGDFLLTWNKFFYVWSDNFTGDYLSSGYLYLLRSFFELGQNAYVAQASFLLVVFLIGYFGMYLIFTKFHYHPFVRFVLPFLYIFNPASSIELTNGYTGALVIYALVPILFLLANEILTDYSYRRGLAFSLVVAICLLSLQIAFWILASLVLFIFLKTLWSTDAQAYKRVVQLAFFGFVGLLLNSVSLLTLFGYADNFSKLSYLSTFNYTYATAIPLNLFVLLGNRGSSQMKLGYHDSMLLFGLAFLIFTLLVSVYVSKIKVLKNRDEKDFVLYSMSSLLILIGALFSIHVGLFDKLIIGNNLFITSLRSPVKLFYALSFNYVFLFGFFVHWSICKIKVDSKHSSKKLVLIFLIFVSLVYGAFNKHYFSRDLGFAQMIGNSSYYVTDKYDVLTELMNSEPNHRNFIYLPFDYPIQLKLNTVTNLVEQRMGSTIRSSIDGNVIAPLYQGICQEDLSLVSNNILNIEYVVLDKDPITYHAHPDIPCSTIEFYGTPYIWGSYDYFNRLFQSYSVYYEDNFYKIYKLNTAVQPEIFSQDNLYSFGSVENIKAKYDFVNDKLRGAFSFVTPQSHNITDSLIDVGVPFESVGFSNVSDNSALKAIVSVDPNKATTFYNMGSTKAKVFVNNLAVANGTNVPLQFVTRENIVKYQNTARSFANVIRNGSFESGAWQEKVGDCRNYDKNPLISMGLSTTDKSDGEQALQLEAIRHNACTQTKVPVRAAAHYLFSFDYQTPNTDVASYYISFNNEAKTVISAKLPVSDTVWHTFTDTITVPDGASVMSLYVYALESDGKTKNINRYDNFKLIEVPDIGNSYYIVSEPKEKLVEPKSVGFDLVNPTRKLVHIQGATTPFFLAMSESYHDQWQLELNNARVQGFLESWWPFAKSDKVRNEYHYQLSGFLNAWYVDPSTLCSLPEASCTKHADGSYDIEMQIEFWPQRWFYLGLLISATTLLGSIGYLGYDFTRRRQLRKK